VPWLTKPPGDYFRAAMRQGIMADNAAAFYELG
jgi:hypothetical protein